MAHIMTDRRATGITGRHVLIAMLAFFGVVFAVNGAFLYFAIGSYTGVVANEPYRKGLEYNQRIAFEARQEALGWTHSIGLGVDGAVRMTIADRNGAAVGDLVVKATVGRPSTAAADHMVELERTAAGAYEAALGVLEPGTWLVIIEAGRLKSDGTLELVYRAKERKWLKP